LELPLDTVQRARRGIVIYLAVLIVLSAPIQTLIVKNGLSILNITMMVMVPSIASCVARCAMREGFKDVSFRLGRGSGKALMVGWCYPVLVGVVAYGIAWSTGLAELAPATQHATTGITIPGSTPAIRLFAGGLLSFIIGPLVGAVVAIGEEMGWRGYLLIRLIDAKIPRPVLVTGLIWSSWHLPIIFGGQYLPSPNPMLAAAMFMLTLVALSYVHAWLRLESGSVWPAVLLHASWNEFIFAFFAPSTRGPRAVYWLGESGILVSACAVLVTAMLVRGLWHVRRAPSDRPFAELRAFAL
jgi:membrane protease YdiL (CAAX protease family)